MWLFVIVAVVVVALAGLWMLGPTAGTFRGPSFAPADKDEASVLRAQQTSMVDGGQ